MKSLTSALLAAAVACQLWAAPALAQPGGWGAHEGRPAAGGGHGYGRAEPGPRYGGYRQPTPAPAWGGGSNPARGRGAYAYPPPSAYGRPYYAPLPRYGAAGAFPRWRRGEVLPPSYRGYPLADYARYHLRRPPRGYYWCRAGEDFILVAAATGLIFEVINAYD
jgi:Ni/Co efflux regulator RcnB